VTAPGRPIVAISRLNMPGDPPARLSPMADLRLWPEKRYPTAAELLELTDGAVALLCVNGDVVDAAFMARRPDLKLIAIASTGYDSIDVAAVNAAGAVVTNSRGTLFETTADLTFGLILAARRRIVEADRYVRAGRWDHNDLDFFLGYDVYGATLGIVGYGEIGQAVARRARGFGMTIVHHRRQRGDDELSRWVELDELLRISDVVALHIPSTPETRHYIGERELRLMKPTATFVNAARGAVVDEAALIRALREGWIGSAGLDVQQTEPNPDPNDPLLAFPNCVVLPHIGSATMAARARMVGMATENIVALFEGRALLTPVGERSAPR
jgi:lactate dehydrogenase-like 2-hydroxyacid dehydrogenase